MPEAPPPQSGIEEQSGTEETIFTWGAPPLKFGAGASDEIGFDMAAYGARRVLVITDPGVAATGIPHRIADRLGAAGIRAEIFDGVGSRDRGTVSSRSAAAHPWTPRKRSTCS